MARMLSFFNVIIVSERKVIILYIEVIQLALMCHCKEKIYFRYQLFNFDDVVRIRRN
jgi:hypothetical protein